MCMCVFVCVPQTDVAAAQFAINLRGAGDLSSSSWSHILLQIWGCCCCCHLLERIMDCKIKLLSNVRCNKAKKIHFALERCKNRIVVGDTALECTFMFSNACSLSLYM